MYHRAILEMGSWGLVDSGNGSLGAFEAWGLWGLHGLLEMGFGNCLLLGTGFGCPKNDVVMLVVVYAVLY